MEGLVKTRCEAVVDSSVGAKNRVAGSRRRLSIVHRHHGHQPSNRATDPKS
jgi:hypothetical protein